MQELTARDYGYNQGLARGKRIERIEAREIRVLQHLLISLLRECERTNVELPAQVVEWYGSAQVLQPQALGINLASTTRLLTLACHSWQAHHTNEYPIDEIKVDGLKKWYAKNKRRARFE